MQRFLSKREVRDKVKLSQTQIDRLEQAGRFPARIALPGLLGVCQTSRRVWLESEIDAWILAKIQRARS
jgi:predicted DNA-binding transcriptional regulator AlpA